MNHERVLAVMDKDINKTRAKLDQLTNARNQYALACGLVKRGRGNGGCSLLSTLLGVMEDGNAWRVMDLVAALKKQGQVVSRAYVSAAMARGADADGPFERTKKGVYRVKPDTVAKWARKVA